MFAGSFSSLPQRPRSPAEDVRFGHALEVMGDLYASAIGTTVLQIKEIPDRPAEYDGALALFGVEAVQVSCARRGEGQLHDA